MASTFGEYLKGIESNPEPSAKTGSFGDYLKNNEATINDSMSQSPTTGTLGTYGQTLGQAVKGIPASVASMVEGSTPYTENNFLDKIQADDQASQQEFVNRPGRDAPALWDLANQGEIREAAPSLSGSGVAMAPMLAGAGIGGAIGGPVGALAGGVIGTGLGLYGMYRQGENQFVKQAIDQENANRANQSLPPLTQQEAIAKQDQINASGDTAKSGLAQSLPEMAGNAAELGIAMTPIGKAGGIVSKLIPKNVLGRAAAVGGAKLAAVMGTELGEEEITRRFQNPINERNNLPTQSFEDIAKPTLIATAPFGALAGGAGVYHGIKGPMDNAASVAPVVEPTQPEDTVEPPETAATTETPVSNAVAPVDANVAPVEPSNTVNSVNPNTVNTVNTANTVNSAEPESPVDNQFDLVGEKSKALAYANQIKDDRRLVDDTTGKIYTANGYIWGKVINANIPFDQALDEFNTEYARQSQSTPASPGADNQRTEPSIGEARTEIPGTKEGSEVTQGTTDQKLTGENNGQIAGTDQGATGTGIGTADVTNLNTRLPEIDGADNGTAIPPIVNADGGANRNSDSSDGRGFSGELPGGVNGTGRISDPTLGDNGAIDQNPVLRAGNELPNELTPPVDTAQQSQQEINDEKAIKETPNAGQERLLGTFKTSKGSVYQVHGDGTTSRDKAARNDPGHEGDSGKKARSVKTIYIDNTGWGLAPGLDFRVVDLGNNKASLVWRNKDGQFGGTEDTLNIPYSTTPKVGLHPVELWKEQDHVDNRPLSPGVRVFKKMHPGNTITEYLENKQNEDKTGTNDTQKAISTTPQAESAQPVTGADTIGTDTPGQEEKAKPSVKSSKPYKLSTGKALFREAVADKLLSKLEKSDNTAGKYYKDEVSKGVFQLIPKASNSKSVEIDGIKPQEQDVSTTIPKQPITQEAKQSDEQVQVSANSDEVAAQSGKAADGEEEVQGKSKEPDDGAEMEHNGNRIYPTTIKGEKYFTVESVENRDRRLSGEKTIGGDNLFKSLDEAKGFADQDSQRRKSKAEQAKKSQEEEEKKAIEESKVKSVREDTDGYADALPPMQKGLAISVLSSRLRIDGKIDTVKNHIRDLVAQGKLPSTREENKVKDASRRRYNQMDNKEQAEHERKVKEGGKKTVYQVGDYEVNKIAHDYAQHLINQGNNVKEAQQAETTPETETPEQKVAVDENYVTDKSIPKKDKDLLTTEEIETRLQSIHKQIQALDDISNPRNMDAYNKKYKNLVDRREELSTRINKIKRESKLDEKAKAKPVQPEPATDTSGTPAADVDSKNGQEVLGEEAVSPILTTPKARYIQKSKAAYAKEHKNATTEQKIKAFKAIEDSYDHQLKKANAESPSLERDFKYGNINISVKKNKNGSSYDIFRNGGLSSFKLPRSKVETEINKIKRAVDFYGETTTPLTPLVEDDDSSAPLAVTNQSKPITQIPGKQPETELKQEVNVAEIESVQSESSTDTSGTPSADVDSSDGQEVLGQETVNQISEKKEAIPVGSYAKTTNGRVGKVIYSNDDGTVDIDLGNEIYRSHEGVLSSEEDYFKSIINTIKGNKRKASELRKEAAEYNKSTNGRAVKNKGNNAFHETNKGYTGVSTYISPISENRESATHSELIARANRLLAEADKLSKLVIKDKKEPKNIKLAIRKLVSKKSIGTVASGGNVNVMEITNIPKAILDKLNWLSVYYKPGMPQEVYAKTPETESNLKNKYDNNAYIHLFDGDVNDIIPYINDLLVAKPIAQIPENQSEQELKQEDTVAQKVAESDKKAVRTENKELIGKGSSGEVFKIGNEVEKKSTNDEAKVYGLLSGVEGIAKGYEVNGKIRTPYYKNIISVDTIKYDDRKGLAGLISKSVERINHAVSELTNTGYYYNDPLQFGMNEDHSLDLIDFSMAINKEGDRVLNDNLSLLASFYKQFGLTRQAEAVSQVKEVITNQHHHVKYGTNALLGDEFDGVNYKELTDRLDGKKANNAYYTTNARYVNIKDTAQTDNINGIKTILSVNKLSDKAIKGWELVPVHEQANTEATVETDNTPLSIFTQMEEAKKLPRKDVIAAENAAQERMDASPMADKLNYIHKNYYSLVQELIDRKDDPVKLTNCKTL